jgi:hypothetical protein
VELWNDRTWTWNSIHRLTEGGGQQKKKKSFKRPTSNEDIEESEIISVLTVMNHNTEHTVHILKSRVKQPAVCGVNNGWSVAGNELTIARSQIANTLVNAPLLSEYATRRFIALFVLDWRTISVLCGKYIYRKDATSGSLFCFATNGISWHRQWEHHRPLRTQDRWWSRARKIKSMFTLSNDNVRRQPLHLWRTWPGNFVSLLSL